MILIWNKDEQELVQRIRALGGVEQASALSAQVVRLKTEIADLEIGKSKLVEDFEKRERELRHMVGLERQRQEEERKQQAVAVAQAAKEATIAVREENLASDKRRFEEQLTFNTERFATMERYLKEMLADIIKRLPTVKVKMEQ